MSLRTARILRRAGLLIEAVALFGFVAVNRLNVGGDRDSFFHPASLCAIALCVGFFVWALGTGMSYRARVMLKKRVRPLDL